LVEQGSGTMPNNPSKPAVQQLKTTD